MCSDRYHDISDTFLHNLSIMYLFVSNLLLNIYIISFSRRKINVNSKLLLQRIHKAPHKGIVALE